jgi:hypothetical protein
LKVAINTIQQLLSFWNLLFVLLKLLKLFHLFSTSIVLLYSLYNIESNQLKGLRWRNHFGGVMVSVLDSKAVDREFEQRSGQTFCICICCFSVKHAVSKIKCWLVRNWDNVSRVVRHVYQRTVVSVSLHYTNPTKREWSNCP